MADLRRYSQQNVPEQNSYSEAVISVKLSQATLMDLVDRWTRKWEKEFVVHLEATRYGERIHKVVAPVEALRELPIQCFTSVKSSPQ